MKNLAARILFGLGFMLVSAHAIAADFNYTWAQLTYDDVDNNFSGLADIDADGFSFSGAFEVTPAIYVKARYSTWDADFGIDLDYWEFGVGFHTPIQNQTDLVVEAGIGEVELSSSLASVDVDTWSVSAGVRHQIGNEVELGATIGIVDYDDDDTETFFGLNALYNFQKNLAGVFEYRTDDNVDVLSLGLRLYF